MKAARLHVLNEPLKIDDIPIPLLEPNEALIKTMACGICHTDLHLIDGRFSAGGKFPFVLGHEPAGVVEKVGKNVTRWKPGQRVVTFRSHTCGECGACLSGYEGDCYNPKGLIGFNCDGGFAEYFKWPATHLLAIPDSIAYEDAGPLGCSGQTAFHTVKTRAQLKLGETVLINSCGGLGMMALQFAKLAGAKVYATDIEDKKLEMALEYGADGAFNPRKLNVAEAVKKLTENLGVHVVLDFVGTAESMELGLNSLRKLGRLVVAGVGHDPIPRATASFLLSGEYSILGAKSSNRQELKDTLEMVASGKVKSIVTRTFKLQELNEALELLKAGKIMGRACVKF